MYRIKITFLHPPGNVVYLFRLINGGQGAEFKVGQWITFAGFKTAQATLDHCFKYYDERWELEEVTE